MKFDQRASYYANRDKNLHVPLGSESIVIILRPLFDSLTCSWDPLAPQVLQNRAESQTTMASDLRHRHNNGHNRREYDSPTATRITSSGTRIMMMMMMMMMMCGKSTCIFRIRLLLTGSLSFQSEASMIYWFEFLPHFNPFWLDISNWWTCACSRAR